MVWTKMAAAATAFGQTVVGKGPAPDALTRAWESADAHLGPDRHVEHLRYSVSWTARAAAPAGEVRCHQAADAVSALEGLAASFRRDG